MLITASMRQLMEEAELLQMAVRIKQVNSTALQAISPFCDAGH
jgi:hypothetical protein